MRRHEALQDGDDSLPTEREDPDRDRGHSIPDKRRLNYFAPYILDDLQQLVRQCLKS